MDEIKVEPDATIRLGGDLATRFVKLCKSLKEARKSMPGLSREQYAKIRAGEAELVGWSDEGYEFREIDRGPASLEEILNAPFGEEVVTKAVLRSERGGPRSAEFRVEAKFGSPFDGAKACTVTITEEAAGRQIASVRPLRGREFTLTLETLAEIVIAKAVKAELAAKGYGELRARK